MPADLRMQVLMGIMRRMGERRDLHSELTDTRDFLDLVPDVVESAGEDGALFYLGRHLSFLINEGYLSRMGSDTFGGLTVVRLTNQGEKFVQPELTEFGSRPFLPDVVNSVEKQILSYPAEKRDSFLFELRDAIARNRAEIAAKLLVEVLPKLVGAFGPVQS
jgi:hypothetical protein